MDPLIAAASVFAVISASFFLLTLVAVKRRRVLGTLSSALMALLMLTLSALMGTITVATQGYRALTKEEVAATVEVTPSGPQQFTATLEFPDGRRETYMLAGDQIYVDAHILKWKPIVNMLGLHTTYELDRVGGRYTQIDQEQDGNRTLFSLKSDKPLDMFSLRSDHSWLDPLLDTTYGSGTFVTVDEPLHLEVLVSTTGLLIRRGRKSDM